jgi:predicted dehydrogenase
MIKVAIIGSGLQARRRAPILKESKNSEIKIITAEHLKSSKKLAKELNCEAGVGWKGIVDRDDIDAVMVLTPPDTHAEISIAAMKAGKHVLCEKPLCRSIEEAENMIQASKENNVILKCGFNHRHHPAVSEAKKILDKGGIGKPLFGRCNYGICGRPGYENEWRANPDHAAGGQFLEQGIHAIDLFSWFMGEISEVTCMTGIQFFKDQKLEDNGMAIFRMKSGATASIHASLTHWKNLFSFEVFGKEGYLEINGLGTSYGTEKLIYGKKDYDAPFNYHITEFRGADKSWLEEWKEFYNSIQEDRKPIGDGNDGLMSLKVALGSYEAERKGKVLKF